MTSQVAVYNMNGIAVASDTVVTSSSQAGSKTTANAEKIYEVGANHKVLVLHYGGTLLNDVNHQFHFGEWALTLTEPLATLSDYVDAYLKWSSHGRKFHSKKSERYEMVSVMRDHFNYLKREIDKAVEALEPAEGVDDEWRQSFFVDVTKREITDGLNWLKSLPICEGLSESKAKEGLRLAEIDLGKFIDEEFAGYPLTTNAKTQLKTSAIQVLIREQSMPWDSTLAFVGFGKDDPFAAVQTVTIRSYYMEQVVFIKSEISGLQPGDTNSQIFSFAQQDAIESFLKGYNSDIMTGVTWAIPRYLREITGDGYNSSLADQLKSQVKDYIEDYSWRRYVQPILRRVAGMNLIGLAELARTLVSIQATFSESQDGPSSVGGLIEVATIDRTNGVRWKHRLPR